jgi:diguanylate cyclase with GGDEF domain
MALEGPARRLHDEIKYRRKFPPRGAAAVKKSELTVRGLGRSGALIAEISRLYTDAAEAVIEEFADALVTKGAALGIVDDADVRRVIAEAHQQTFDEARGLLLDELQGQAGDYRTLVTGIVDDRRRPVWEHLERKLELQRLEMPVLTVAEKEREQKFGILLSPRQAERDFADEVAKAREHGNPVAVLFVDIDHFKMLNATWTNATVDETLLPAVQWLLAKLVQGRGDAYRHGGEEFLLIMPNRDGRSSWWAGQRAVQPLLVPVTSLSFSRIGGLCIHRPNYGARDLNSNLEYDKNMRNGSPVDPPEIGLSEPDGGFDRPVPMGRLLVAPEVTLIGEWLEFRYYSGAARARRVRPSRKLLTEFLKLRDSTDSILRFARRWGPLGFCAHDLPLDRCLECLVPEALERRRESLATWRRIIRHVQWLLDTGARLQTRDLDVREEEFIGPPPTEPIRFPPVGPVAKTYPQIRRWSEFLNTYLARDMEDSNLRLTFSLAERRPRLVVGFRSLFGALFLQLALVITQSRGLTTCSSCGDPFFPQRNWKYCNGKGCGRKAALRAASKRYYWKEKESRGRKKVTRVRTQGT